MYVVKGDRFHEIKIGVVKKAARLGVYDIAAQK